MIQTSAVADGGWRRGKIQGIVARCSRLVRKGNAWTETLTRMFEDDFVFSFPSLCKRGGFIGMRRSVGVRGDANTHVRKQAKRETTFTSGFLFTRERAWACGHERARVPSRSDAPGRREVASRIDP